MMHFDLPDTARDLQQVITRWARDHGDRPVPTATGAELADLGVLDLLTGGPDDASHVHAMAAVEAVGRAGLLVPVAETMWARAHGVAAVDGGVWIASPTAAGPSGRRFVPFASAARSLVVAGPDGVPAGHAVDPSPGHVPIHPEGAWADLAAGLRGFTEVAPALAWRLHAALCVGMVDRMLALALDHLRDRQAFRRRLLTFQGPRFRLSEVHWRVEGLRLLVREAAWRADTGDARADAVSALAWLHTRRVGHAVARHLHQAMGATGFQDDTGVIRLSGTLASLRLAVGAHDAAACVWGAVDRTAGTPRSTVLDALTSPTDQFPPPSPVGANQGGSPS